MKARNRISITSTIMFLFEICLSLHLILIKEIKWYGIDFLKTVFKEYASEIFFCEILYLRILDFYLLMCINLTDKYHFKREKIPWAKKFLETWPIFSISCMCLVPPLIRVKKANLAFLQNKIHTPSKRYSSPYWWNTAPNKNRFTVVKKVILIS